MSTTATAPARAAAVDGARAITPMVLGVVPFGIAIGAAVADAAVPAPAGWAGSFLLLAGSSQLALVELLDAGSGAALAAAVAVVVNLRLLVYGAGLSGWFPSTGRGTRLLLAVPLVDQLYLTVVDDFGRHDRPEHARRWFYAGAATHLATAWVAAQTLGVLVGQSVPTWLHLEAAAPLSLSGLLALSLKGGADVRAAAAAGTVMAAGIVPGRLTVLAAIAAGLAAGTSRERS